MIFLTGGSGFLGKHVLQKLSKMNIEVCCLGRRQINDARWVKVDLTKLPLSDDILKGCSKIIHTAAAIKGSVAHLNKINYDGTKELIRVAKSNEVKKFIFISSLDAIMFDSAYATSKRQAEEAVKKSGMDWLIIRPSWIFGINDARNFDFLNNFIKRFPLIPLPSKGLFRMQPVFVDDLAEFIINCTLNDAYSYKCLNVVGPEILTFSEIVVQLQKHNKIKRIKIPISQSVIDALQKLTSLTLGKHKSEEIFLSFKDKIAPSGHGEKIELSTRFSRVFS